MDTTTTTALTEAERRTYGKVAWDSYHGEGFDDIWEAEAGPEQNDWMDAAADAIAAYLADHAPPGTPRPGVGAAGEREWLVEKLAQGWIAWPFRHGGIGRNEYQCGRAGSGDTPTEAIANGCEVNRWFDAADDLADPAAGERARRSVRVVRGATIVNDEWTVEITDGEQTVYVETNTAGWDFLRKALAAAPDGGDGGVK